MDALKRLSLEFDGIANVIKDWTDSADIVNYVNKLKSGIKNNDIEIINYTLNKINEWYDNNINVICESELFGTPDKHFSCMYKVKEFLNEFKNYKIVSDNHTNENMPIKENPYIFISHKSSDKKYGDALRNFITGLGVKNNQLIYTSHPLHKIPLDKNIYEFLREHISKNVFVIILWSDKYLDSPACLNEMGAAWVAQSDYTNIYVPAFSFGNPKYHECAVDTRKMGAVLNGDEHCKTSMIELKNKIQTLFNLENDEKQSNYLLDQFIKEITEDSQNGQT